MPTDVGIEVEGLDEAQMAVQDFVDSVARLSDRELELAGGRIIRATSKYPPPIPTSKYDRTGIYGRTFTMQKLEAGVWMLTSNAVQRGRGYSPFVGGGESGLEQATVHAGRWPVFLEKAIEEAEVASKNIDEQTQEEARKRGLT